MLHALRVKNDEGALIEQLGFSSIKHWHGGPVRLFTSGVRRFRSMANRKASAAIIWELQSP
jgi:hypothetical protein